jgi:transposase
VHASSILAAAAGTRNSQIAKQIQVHYETVQRWRDRWAAADSRLQAIEATGKPKQLSQAIEDLLTDEPRPGAPATFTFEQFMQIRALACERPETADRPVSTWTPHELAEEAIKGGIVATISARTVERFLQGERETAPLQALLAYPPAEDPQGLTEQICSVCEVYESTPALVAQGAHVMSTDEMTGIQALERLHPCLPMLPGHVERQECEYERHGTLSLIANLEVATGQVVMPSIGPTRTEADFAAHIRQTIQTDPQAAWIFITDQLNTHQSETLVRLIAEQCDLQEELGIKGKSGHLATMKTRAAFLSDPSHRIRFVYTPKHSSWLNQIEIW